MSTNQFSWLHLTDFHYGLKGQDCLWPTLREPFLDSLASLHERCGPWDAVLFTGDLVQSGESAQFEEMQKQVLDPLWKRLDELGSEDAVLLAVPGNHDLYRPNPDEDAAADRLLDKDGFERVQEKFWDRPTSPYRRVITNAFAAYGEWWKKAPHRAADVKTGTLPGDFSATLESGGRRIGIMGLNTTFLQLGGGDYKGRLVWDACADRAAAHWQAARVGTRERTVAIRLRGVGHMLAKDYPAAITTLREALDLRRSLAPKNQADVAIVLNSLAEVMRECGQLDEAEIHYREALEIAKALPKPESVANYTGNLAEVALDREQWPEAERLARRALRQAEEVGRKETIAEDCWRLAKALARQGRGTEGLCHAERAVAICTELRSLHLVKAQATLDECLAANE